MKCGTCQTTICVRTPENSAIKVGYQDACVVLDLKTDNLCSDGPCGPSVQEKCRDYSTNTYPGPITYINDCACPKVVSIWAAGDSVSGISSLNASTAINGQLVPIGTYLSNKASAGTTASFRQDVVIYPGHMITFEPYITGIFDKVFYGVTAY